MQYKYIFFDVAQTLLYKPLLFNKIEEVLSSYGYVVDINLLKRNHKLLSEAILFPDKTSEEFYQTFNAQLLYSLGIIPDEKILKSIFKNCSYLSWEKFDDTSILEVLQIPLGIISNWDNSLEKKLKLFFETPFFNIIASQNAGVKKPSLSIFKLATQDLKCSMEEIVYVGDSIKLDIEPAIKSGLTAILIDRENYFPAYNGKKINDLRELKKTLYE
jgi:putative hydrolase of the HAD superfamily